MNRKSSGEVFTADGLMSYLTRLQLLSWRNVSNHWFVCKKMKYDTEYDRWSISGAGCLGSRLRVLIYRMAHPCDIEPQQRKIQSLPLNCGLRPLKG